MLELTKVTYENEELEAGIKKNLKKLEQVEYFEVTCYPMTDGCCIKAGDGLENKCL